MALSKSTRIIILLTIDLLFFFLELIVGTYVHSLALVADSFHMLNDVLSLCVGLWAVKVAGQKQNSKTYTYGWQRAETLGALVNGVFLVALCLSIFLEAVQRLFRPQKVENPMLVLIVGCFGLASNILGLFLFHDLGHSHDGGGGNGHSHGSDEVSSAEEGHGDGRTGKMDGHTAHMADESGNIADILPQATVGGFPKSEAMKKAGWEGSSSETTKGKTRAFTQSDEDGSTAAPSKIDSASTQSPKKSSLIRRDRGSRSRLSVDEINFHPASFRQEIIKQSKLDDISSETGSAFSSSSAIQDEERASSEDTPLLNHSRSNGAATHESKHSHDGHDHKQSEKNTGGGGHGGHSHDLNMRGVFLHVLGDALGNVGVIGSALIIWLATGQYRFYADPIISLLITVIILYSAIPLCKAASRILLQAVPSHISVDEVKEDIMAIPGIIGCHHLHVWQLSDVKSIATLHVQVDSELEGKGGERYMGVAKGIQTILHDYGIHSSTIQPEFCLDESHQHFSTGDSAGSSDCEANGRAEASKKSSKRPSNAPSFTQPDACLLECGDECGAEGQCCAPGGREDELD